jgi:hypothetical protein
MLVHHILYSRETIGMAEARRQSEVISRARHTNNVVSRVLGDIMISNITLVS